MTSLWSTFDLPVLPSPHLASLTSASLQFHLYWDSTHTLVCREAHSSLPVPLLLSQSLSQLSKGLEFARVLKHCVGRYVCRRGVEVVGTLRGGGCCNSSMWQGKDSVIELGTGTLKKLGARNSQQEALHFAENIRDLYYKGISTGIPLRSLHDIPQTLIISPFAVSECLLEAIDEPGFWSEKLDFLVRHEVVRIARRQLVDYIVGNRVEFMETHKEKMGQMVKKLAEMARDRDEVWPESGVLAELSTLKMFITSAHDTSRILQKMTHACVLGFAYTSPLPTPIPPLSSLSDAIKSITAFRHSMELQLLIDDLYFQAERGRMEELMKIVGFLLGKGASKSWKTFYLTLAFVEWAVHRNLWTDDLIPSLLLHLDQFHTISLCTAMGLRKKSWRLCEKLATILTKAYPNPLFRPLYLEMLQNEKDKRIQSLLILPDRMLVCEPDQGKTQNFTGDLSLVCKETDLSQAKGILMTKKKLGIVGDTGSGKTEFVKSFAVLLSNEFDLMWLCDATSRASLCSSLRSLSWNLATSATSFDSLFETVSNKRCLFLLENVPSDCISDRISFLPASAYCVWTSESGIGEEHEVMLKPWENANVSALLTAIPSQKVRMVVDRLMGNPLLVSLAKGFVSDFGENFIEEIVSDSINHGNRVRDIAEMCVAKAMAESQEYAVFLQTVAVLSPDDAMEELYQPAVRLIDISIDTEKVKQRLEKLGLIRSGFAGAVALSKAVRMAVLDNTSEDDLQIAIESVVKIAETIFSFESHSETNARLSISLISLSGFICDKPNPTYPEFTLCLKLLLYALSSSTDVPLVAPLLRSLSDWFDSNPAMYDSNEFAVPHFLAHCCLQTSNLDKAADYYQTEVSVCESTLAENSMDLAEACETLASVWFRLREWRKAEETQTRAVRIREKAGIGGSLELATSYSVLSGIHYEQQKWSEAEHFQLLCINIHKQTQSSDLPTLYSNLSSIYHAQGNFEAALSAQQQAIRLDEERVQGNAEDLAVSYGNLGNVYRELGEWEKAEGWALKAVEMKEEIFPEGHPQLAISYHSLARIYLSQGKAALADDYESKAIEIAERTPAFDQSWYAHFLHTMASIAKYQGKLAESLDFITKSLEIRLESLKEDKREIARVYRTFAEILFALGKIAEAEETMKKAVKIAEITLSSTSTEMQSLYREFSEVLKSGPNVELRTQIEGKLVNSNH